MIGIYPTVVFAGSTLLCLLLNAVQDGLGSWFWCTNKKARSDADVCDLGTSTLGFLNQSAFTFVIFGSVEPLVKFTGIIVSNALGTTSVTLSDGLVSDRTVSRAGPPIGPKPIRFDPF